MAPEVIESIVYKQPTIQVVDNGVERYVGQFDHVKTTRSDLPSSGLAGRAMRMLGVQGTTWRTDTKVLGHIKHDGSCEPSNLPDTISGLMSRGVHAIDRESGRALADFMLGQ